MENKLGTIYKILRVVIYLIPAFAVIMGIYLVLFPAETYKFFSNQPNISKFEIEKSAAKNELSFGVSPIQKHRFIDLDIDFKKAGSKSCPEEKPQVSVQQTYRSFLFPEGDPITSKEDLRGLAFSDNKAKYSNGSLLHLKPTDEVYLISDGKKILFPGPEIFYAFGYSFDNLVDVDKSTLDQFPDADDKVFLWKNSHPNGTIFQSFPSHNLYLVTDGEKRRIENADFLKEIWPDFFAIAVSDSDAQGHFLCREKAIGSSDRKLNCSFDSRTMPESIGRYNNFIIKFPENCGIDNILIEKAGIDFVVEKSYATAKDSLRNVFALILNRYFYKQ